MIHFGVVEDRKSDPLKLGRCKVRIVGLHNQDKAILPTVDLPWATPIQSIAQAGSNGIGISPTGLLEGSWVAVTFADEYKQIPIIIGSIAGFKPNQSTQDSVAPETSSIPTPTLTAEVPSPVSQGDGSVLTSGDGTPVSQGERTTIQVPAPDAVQLFEPKTLSTSSYGMEMLKKEEGLCSSSKTSKTITSFAKLVKQYGDDVGSVKLYSYKDTKGIWTIGYGQTYLSDNSKVTETTELTYGECEQLFRTKLKNEFEAGVKRNLKVKVTQSMFDALVSMAYNMGVGGLTSQDMFQKLNAGEYATALGLITSTRANGLANRRAAERALFLKDGIPNGIPPAEAGSTGTSSTTANDDIKKKYLANTSTSAVISYSGEVDTNRLARNERFATTVKEQDDNNRRRFVQSADGTVWQQPLSYYGTEYPHNQLRYTESGHLEEFDDTPGYERINIRHKVGTFIEIDANGQQVNRIVGDSYQIIDRHGFISIEGNCHITVAGNANINVENNATLSVSGNLKQDIGGDMTFGVGGKTIIGSTGDVSIRTAGTLALDGKIIHLNSDKAAKPDIKKKAAKGNPKMEILSTNSRKNNDVHSSYETPEEGNNSAYVEHNSHALEQKDIQEIKGAATEEKDAPVKTPAPISTACDNLSDADIKSSYQLTPNFTLGRLLSSGQSGYPRGTNYGLTGSQIVCNLKKLSANVLEKVYEQYPTMIITSAWRSEAVNNQVKGQKTSDHLFGRAVDIQFPGFTRSQYLDAASKIREIVPAFKQIILEYKGGTTWIHVSYDDRDNKCQCLTMDASINKTLASGKFVLIA